MPNQSYFCPALLKVFTESVRLTDEAALHEQTDEEGDIFHWLTYQAKQGVLSAQVIGHILKSMCAHVVY